MDQSVIRSQGRATGPGPLLVALGVAVLVLIINWLWKAPCAVDDPFAQFGGRMWVSACYNDPVLLYQGRQLDVGVFPYQPTDGSHQPMEYPVLTGLWMWGVARAAHWLGTVIPWPADAAPTDISLYFAVSAAPLGLLYLGAVVLTSRLTVRRPWDVLIMCASPLLLVHAFTNWDAIPIVLTAAAMLAWARDRPILAGVLLAMGTAAKLYPVFLLGPLLVLCLRSGRMPAWYRAAAATAGAWLLINLPILLLYPRGWYEFIRLNSERSPEWDTWYFVVSTVTGHNVPAVNVLSLALFLIACLAIGWFALSVRRRPRLAQLAFLVITAFLLTNKVWSPQYSLWLLPLLVLALPRWIPLLAWQASEAVVWLLLTPHLGPLGGLTMSVYPFIASVLVRDALLLVLVYLVIRDILSPERDLVRCDGVDDPVGGVLDGATDRFTVPSLGQLLGRSGSDRSGPHRAGAD